MLLGQKYWLGARHKVNMTQPLLAGTHNKAAHKVSFKPKRIETSHVHPVATNTLRHRIKCIKKGLTAT